MTAGAVETTSLLPMLAAAAAAARAARCAVRCDAAGPNALKCCRPPLHACTWRCVVLSIIRRKGPRLQALEREQRCAAVQWPGESGGSRAGAPSWAWRRQSVACVWPGLGVSVVEPRGCAAAVKHPGREGSRIDGRAVDAALLNAVWSEACGLMLASSPRPETHLRHHRRSRPQAKNRPDHSPRSPAFAHALAISTSPQVGVVRHMHAASCPFGQRPAERRAICVEPAS